MTTKTNICPECGGEMVWEKRPSTVQYQGHKKTVKVNGWWCGNCGEGILEGKELLARERAFKELKAQVEGVLGPAEITRIRERVLHLSQRLAGKILGGGLRAFQKYESGETTVSLAMSHLLRLLEKHPALMDELKKAAAPAAKTPPSESERRPKRAKERAQSRATN